MTEGSSTKGGDASRVALVFPYFRTRAATELLLPPLGLATLAAQLRRLGVEARVFDGTFSSPDRLVRELVAYVPAIVGISAMVSLTGNALRVAECVRTSMPQALLVAGGPLPTVFPRRFAPHVDGVFRGEADLSFPRFCRDYLRFGGRQAGSPYAGDRRHDLSRLPLAHYDGLFVEQGDLHVDNAPVHHGARELASFPLPDRSDFDHATYQREWMQKMGTRTTSLIITLGCPYACDFCSKPVFGNKVRRRPLAAVFAEVDQLRELGYDSLWVADDTLTLNQRFLADFCRGMTGRGMSWSCLSRPDAIDPAMGHMMKAAGCAQVYLGLESGSPRTLDLMNKRATVTDGKHAVEMYRAAGIRVAAFFLVGYPGEDQAAIESTFALALSLPLDEISFNVPVPLPGAPLFERLGRPDAGRDWTRENDVTFLFPAEIDESWLRRRIDETMTVFAERREARAAAPAAAQATPQADAPATARAIRVRPAAGATAARGTADP